MNFIVFNIQIGCEALNERGIILVYKTSNELSLIVVISRNYSSHSHEAIDAGSIETLLISDHTKNTVRSAFHVSTTIAISNTNGVIGLVSVLDEDVPNFIGVHGNRSLIRIQ